MIEFIMQPWPWWFSGVLIGLTVPLLFLLAGKAFGISTSFQEAGAMCAPCKCRDVSGVYRLVRRLCRISLETTGSVLPFTPNNRNPNA